MSELTPLRATQLSAKLAHAWKRLRSIELEVRNGLPTGACCRYRDVPHAGREFADVLRYLRTIEKELSAQLPDFPREPRKHGLR